MPGKRLARPALYYEFRVSLGTLSLLPLLGLPAFAVLQWLFTLSDGGQVDTYDLVRAFELVLPLSAGLAVAHLMTVEREEGVAELRASYPEPAWRLPAGRTLVGLALAALALAAGAAAFRIVFGPVLSRALLGPALPPTLFLLALSLLVGNVSGSYWMASALVLGYWFFEIQTRGEITQQLFLFQWSWPREGVDYLLNRHLLASLGMLLLLANGPG